MNDKHQTVSASLDADEQLLPFLPELLQDLWSLGFSPDPMISLLDQCGLTKRTSQRMLDLGCGKGAALILLAQQFGWQGVGVDLVPEFIDAARQRAAEIRITDRVAFEVADMIAAARSGPPCDLILFGFDTDVLGPLNKLLPVISTRLAAGGHIVLDTVWMRDSEAAPACALSEAQTKAAIRACGLMVVGERILCPDWVRAQNDANTTHIRRRATALAEQYPDKRALFADYVRRQGEECRQLECDVDCVLLVLGRDS